MRRIRPLSRLSNGCVCLPLSPVCVGRPLLEMRCHSMARRTTETEARRKQTAQHDRHRHDWWMHHLTAAFALSPYPCDLGAPVCEHWRTVE
mmetsp:Transcript_35011/g.100711  ORF Transcript_35011/g.100711 Transcript_35011/m.100711 type:complete len:91 (-) Transcript_35011:975-1247(-)